MRFVLTDDQVALRDGIRSLLAGRFPMTRVRTGTDDTQYADLADAGVFSLRADGFGGADAAIVFEELGRACVPGPLVWTFLAHGLPGVPDRVPVGGVERPDAWPVLVGGFGAGLLVVDDGGVTWVARDGIDGEPVAWPLDPLSPAWRIRNLAGEGRVADADGAVRWRREGALLTAAYLVGAAAACTDLSVEYAKRRMQFGKVIGAFQAVKHMCADMAVRAEIARASVHAAAVTLDDPEVGDPRRAVSGARVLAGEAAMANGRAATQVHGGMGFTWEVDVHLYLKRAWALDTEFGSVDHHADEVAATLPSPDR